MENKDYRCVNTAYHTGKCCDTCWNQHPEATPDKMFLGTQRHFEIVNEVWNDRAMAHGFSLSQAKFLFKNCR
jgi:hypothetical protein